MTPLRRRYIDGRFGQVHLRESVGKVPAGAPPLVCLHATPFSSRCYAPLLAALGAGRKGYALDTPGYGESDRPPEPMSVAGYAEVLWEAIAALGLADAPLDLVGTHTGTRFAVEMALAHPTVVRRVVLVGAAVYTPAEREYQKTWSYDLEIPKETDSGGEQIMRIWRTFEKHRGAGASDAVLERRLSDILRDRAFSNWAHIGVFAHDLSVRLPHVTQPTLVINADDDLHAMTERAPGLLKDSRYLDLSPAGFAVLETNTAEVAAAVERFLSAS